MYVPSSEILKVQFILDWERLKHSLASTGPGPSTSTATMSVGGVYPDGNWVPC